MSFAGSTEDKLVKQNNNPGQDVFVDYGAGKGRTVVLASTYQFKRVIGVELAPELAAIAEENLFRAIKRLDASKLKS